MEDEVLALVAPWRIIENSAEGGQYATATSIVTVLPDGTVSITVAELDAVTWVNEAAQTTYQCNLGSALKLFAPHDGQISFVFVFIFIFILTGN
jgi:hypothetical protein